MQARIAVRYFAVLKDCSGRQGEELTVDAGAKASDLYGMLAEKYSFPLGLKDVRVAVNDEFAKADQPLKDGDKVVFIPPVSGG